jgi:transketolase
MSAPDLTKMALNVRRDILTMLPHAGSGHTGGPLSCADFGTVLYFHEMSYRPDDYSWDGRDMVFWSIGHVAPVIYSLMAEAGYFDLSELLTLRKPDSILQGHPLKQELPALEVSSGSLGQGLSVAVGAAIGSRLSGNDRRVFCVNGDGELQEGQIWEAIMAGAHYRLDNLTCIVDYNKRQIDGHVEDVVGLHPLHKKFESFNWHVVECDGHDIPDILRAFEQARANNGRPTAILAHTHMGQGVLEIVDDHSWHGKPPSVEEAEAFLPQLGTSFDEWTERLKVNRRDIPVATSR